MTKARAQFIQKRELENHRIIEERNKENSDFKAEYDYTPPAGFLDLGVLWDAQEKIRGRVIHIDFESWCILIKRAKWDFVLVSVDHLKSKQRTRDAAKAIATQLARREFPGEGFSNIVEIRTDGSVELLIDSYLP